MMMPANTSLWRFVVWGKQHAATSTYNFRCHDLSLLPLSAPPFCLHTVVSFCCSFSLRILSLLFGPAPLSCWTWMNEALPDNVCELDMHPFNSSFSWYVVSSGNSAATATAHHASYTYCSTGVLSLAELTGFIRLIQLVVERSIKTKTMGFFRRSKVSLHLLIKSYYI